MASNMWKPVENECQCCGAIIGSEIEQLDEFGGRMTYEDGISPRYLSGSTIEDDDGQYLTVCENCLRAIVRLDVGELMDKLEQTNQI